MTLIAVLPLRVAGRSRELEQLRKLEERRKRAAAMESLRKMKEAEARKAAAAQASAQVPVPSVGSLLAAHPGGLPPSQAEEEARIRQPGGTRERLWRGF